LQKKENIAHLLLLLLLLVRTAGAAKGGAQPRHSLHA
jgi:hypothetical protein